MFYRMNIREFGRRVCMMLQEKHRWLRLLVLLETIYLTFSLILYFSSINNLVSYHFDTAQIASYTSEGYENCFGGTIDESYTAGLYDAIPGIFLKKGYYRYNLSYESSSPGSFSWPHSYSDHFMVIEQAVTYFEDGQGSHTDEFWLNADLDVALRVNYSGSGSATITDFTIQETTILANMELFFRILTLIVVNILIALYCRNRRHPVSIGAKYTFACLVSISLFASQPLFLNYLVPGHDLYFHMVRIDGIKEAILSGQFPVRINPTFWNGYGYANPVLYGELFLYIPAFLRIVGFRLSTAYNVYAVLINIFTCFGGYYCFKKMFKDSAAAVAASALYTMAPYRLMCMYFRMAVGEYTAMTFLPFVIYGMYRIYTEDETKKEYGRCFVTLVIGFTGIIQSHVLTGEITGGIIVLTCVLLAPLTFRKKRFLALVKTLLTTVGINLWFLVPFLDFSLTQRVNIFVRPRLDNIQDSGTYFSQIISLFQIYIQGSGSSSASNGVQGEMPLVLGMPLILGAVLCAVMLTVNGREWKKEKRCGLFLVFFTVLTGWMSTIYFPWDRLTESMPLLRRMITSIQYVWRMLSPASALAAAATCLGLMLLGLKEGKRTAAVVGLVLGMLTSVSAMQWMGEITNLTPIRFDSADDINTAMAVSKSEYTLVGASYERMTQVFEPQIFNGELADYEKQGTNISFTVKRAGESCYVMLPLLNYKGYHVISEDGLVTNKQLSTGDDMVIRIDIPEGSSGRVSVGYTGFWYWRLAEIASAACIVILIVMFLVPKERIKLGRRAFLNY